MKEGQARNRAKFYCRAALTLFAALIFATAPACRASAADSKQKVLAYLRRISGVRTVAGQHNREPNAQPDQSTNGLFALTGKYPGLWSADFLFDQADIAARPAMIAEAKKQWKRGALVGLMFHACRPDQDEPCQWDGGVRAALDDAQWKELVTDGTKLNKVWKARLDLIADQLKDLDEAGVAVLWRPLHEMNQKEFWWGGRPGPEGTAKLYRITHDYLGKTKGLDNLIWVWDVQDLDEQWADYDPGEGYWDVMALDVYGDGYTPQKYRRMVELSGGKPMAIGECRRLPTAAELAAQPRWTFFMGWAELTAGDNAQAAIRALYDADNVVTLDRMPGWE